MVSGVEVTDCTERVLFKVRLSVVSVHFIGLSANYRYKCLITWSLYILLGYQLTIVTDA